MQFRLSLPFPPWRPPRKGEEDFSSMKGGGEERKKKRTEKELPFSLSLPPSVRPSVPMQPKTIPAIGLLPPNGDCAKIEHGAERGKGNECLPRLLMSSSPSLWWAFEREDGGGRAFDDKDTSGGRRGNSVKEIEAKGKSFFSPVSCG